MAVVTVACFLCELLAYRRFQTLANQTKLIIIDPFKIQNATIDTTILISPFNEPKIRILRLDLTSI